MVECSEPEGRVLKRVGVLGHGGSAVTAHDIMIHFSDICPWCGGTESDVVITSPVYNDRLDPISPNFDVRSWSE